MLWESLKSAARELLPSFRLPRLSEFSIASSSHFFAKLFYSWQQQTVRILLHAIKEGGDGELWQSLKFRCFHNQKGAENCHPLAWYGLSMREKQTFTSLWKMERQKKIVTNSHSTVNLEFYREMRNVNAFRSAHDPCDKDFMSAFSIVARGIFLSPFTNTRREKMLEKRSSFWVKALSC